MFFIGLLSTPLPYMVLFGFYLIGLFTGAFYKAEQENEIIQPIKQTIIIDNIDEDASLDVQSTHFWHHSKHINSEQTVGEKTIVLISSTIYKPLVYILEFITSIFHMPFLSELTNRPPPYPVSMG